MNNNATFKPAVYKYPRHGEHDAVMYANIFGLAKNAEGCLALNAPKELILKRYYCMYCWVEKLDKLGVEDMEKVE